MCSEHTQLLHETAVRSHPVHTLSSISAWLDLTYMYRGGGGIFSS